MKIIEEGHIYKLDNSEKFEAQEISFLKRVNGEIIHDGTTNEEILEMLINRLQYLNKKLPCRENAIVITKLEESLMWLNKRTKIRVSQNVETLDRRLN